MDKQLIAERFAKARNTYSREARVQQQVALQMMHLLTTHAPAHKLHHIVEFGCGTGSYSRLLQATLNPHTLLLNDLCSEMEETLADICQPMNFVPGDAEALDFPLNTDLITSCSTLQWFNDPAHFFHRCTRFLNADGYLAFSTFGTDNMREIKQLTGHGLEYLPLPEVTRLLVESGYTIIHAHEERVSLPFATPQQVLKHLKETGVTGTEKKIWTRTRLQTFVDEYIQQFSDTNGNVTLTYHPIYIIAKITTE